MPRYQQLAADGSFSLGRRRALMLIDFPIGVEELYSLYSYHYDMYREQA